MRPRLLLHMFFPVTAAISLALFTDLAKATSVTTSITDATLTASLDPLPALSGATTLVALSGLTASSSPAPLIGTGYTITFSNFLSLVSPPCSTDEGVVQGTDACHAEPVAGLSGGTTQYWTGNYLSTGGPIGQITITFTSPETSLELLWGSIDGCSAVAPSTCTPAISGYPGNSLALNNGTTLTGYQLENDLPGISNASQGYGGSAWVMINTTTPFTTVTFTSFYSSFESADITAADPTPEPGSVFLVGAGLGLAALLRRSTLRKRLKKR
jgi:hypothetical protein